MKFRVILCIPKDKRSSGYPVTAIRTYFLFIWPVVLRVTDVRSVPRYIRYLYNKCGAAFVDECEPQLRKCVDVTSSN